MPVASLAPHSNLNAVEAVVAPLRKFLGRRSIAGESANLNLSAAGTFLQAGTPYEVLRIRLAGPYAGHDPIRLGIFAGIHGDEPAGCTALVQLAAVFAAEPERIAGFELCLYPVINPVGLERGTRCNHAGKDLNREFWSGTTEAEVRILEQELRSEAFAGIITLHSDDTCEGVYGYAHGRTLNESLLAPALRAAQRYLPVDERAVIDGFPARAGLICDCFAGVLSAPPEQRPRPFDLIFETPGHAPFGLQVSAAVAALEEIIAIYPGFIAYAQDI